MNVGEAEIPARVTVREMLVIKPEEMENGSVKIMNVNRILDGLETEFIGLPVLKTGFDSSPRHPHRESVVIVIAPQGQRYRLRQQVGPKFLMMVTPCADGCMACIGGPER